MNKLRFSRAYLPGGMEKAADNGESWRIFVQNSLRDLEIVFLDPTQKPTLECVENSETKNLLIKLREEGDYDGVARIMKPIRAVDLRMVDVSDFLICALDNNINTTGTWEEVFWANRSKKPVLFYHAQGKKCMPIWLFGTFPHEFFFDTWTDLFVYLRKTASGEISHLRWRFFDFSLCRN